MKRQSQIGQMLDHVIGIECVNRTVSKRQPATDVSPNVDLRSDGVHVEGWPQLLQVARLTAPFVLDPTFHVGEVIIPMCLRNEIFLRKIN